VIPKLTSQRDFSVLCDYVFKEGAQRITGNMMGRCPKTLFKEFSAIRQLRREIRTPAWHISLSAPSGERLTDRQWKAIVRYFFQEMELDTSNHQFFVMRHTDTEHEHIHAVVNKIGFDLSIYHSRNDRWKSIEVCKLIEKHFGLKQTIRRDRNRSRALERDFGRAL
jgi:hypothetical protein